MTPTGRTIAVHSFKGGTGKSTVSANLAVALALKGHRVGVMDMDLEGPGLHVIFGLEPDELKHTLNDVLIGDAQPEQAVVRLNQKLGLGDGEVFFTPASVKVSEMLKMLRTGYEVESFSNAVESLVSRFQLDYLIVDTHPGIESDTLLAIVVCDVLLLVSRMDQQDMLGTGIMAVVAKDLEKPVSLVLNMVPRSVKQSDASRLVDRIGANFNVQVLGWLPFSEEITESLSKSVFILANPRHPVTARFNELAARFEGFNGSEGSP